MQPLLIKALVGILVILALLPALRRLLRIDRAGVLWAFFLVAVYVAAFALLMVLLLGYRSDASSETQRLATALVLLGALGSGLVWLVQMLPPKPAPPAWMRAPTGWFSLAAHAVLVCGIMGLALT